MSAPVSIEVSWFWDWVPGAGSDDVERATWADSVGSRLGEWVGAKVANARAAWPADSAEEFPFTVDDMGAAVTRDLLERADAVPPNCRLIWGAGFIGDEARWLPLLILAEFRQALPEDPAYLMAMVGADGLPEDVREPAVDYVTTEHGDGVRVQALAQSEGEGLHGRVNAALRLDRPGVDVLLTTRVSGLDQLAVIGSGVEAVMHMIAGQLPELQFVPPEPS